MVVAPRVYVITNQEIGIDKQLEYLSSLNFIDNKKNIFVQIRMKHLNDNELIYFVKSVKKLLNDEIKILINNRFDLMQKLNLDGVHFRDEILNFSRDGYKNKIFSKSTHSVESIENAIKCNLDFVTYGPVFYTESKKKYGAPKGFRDIENKKLKIPVLALGGINLENIPSIKKYFYGIAGISLFSNNNIINNIKTINNYDIF